MNTTDHNALIRTSWTHVQRQAESFSTTFYDTLFSLEPTLRPMFRGDMALQRERLVAMIDAAVGLLGRPDALMPALRNLGQRHGGYGVRDAHYAVVGAALLHSLQTTLREAFTPALRAAWTEIFGTMSSVMMEAARPAAKPMAMRIPAMAAIALTMVAGSAMAGGPGPFGAHPALMQRSLTLAFAPPAGIDPNTFIVGHPASPTTRGGHANGEHPAVQAARTAARPLIDVNTFIVQPPVAVTWRVEPEVDGGTRLAQAEGTVEAQIK